MARLRTRDWLIAMLILSALLWLLAVVPFFLLGIGMSGSTVGAALSTTWQNATAGDPISIAMVLLTASLVGLPWAVWALIKER